jgi:hypothetical protein
MKDIFKTLVWVVVIALVISKVKSGDISLPKVVSNAIGVKNMLDGDTIYIQGLGKHNYNMLINTKHIIEETYGVPSKIIEPIILTSELYVDGFVNTDKCLSEFDDDKNKILVTNENTYSLKNQVMVDGLSELNGNTTIIVENNLPSFKRVIIHEIGHNSGLEHCEDKHCVMSIDRTDDVHTIYFCDNCKKRL